MTNFLNTLGRFTDVPVLDPDDARRRKLLSIILIGAGILSILVLIIVLIVANMQLTDTSIEDISWILFSDIGFLVGITLFYFINRSKKIPGWVASSLFLLFVMIVLAFSDTPDELAGGRSLFVFVLPVVMASILLRPAFSFVFFGLVSLEIYALAWIGDVEPNILAIISFFLVALISWLSARGLEQAIKDLRSINVNLDNLVEAKTQELAKALSRELVLAGRNQAILESIGDGVIVFDPNGEATQANPAISELLGLEQNQIIGTTIQALTDTSLLKPQDSGALAGLLSSTEHDLLIHRIQWGDKTLSVGSSPVRDSLGYVVGTVAVFRDFTREAEVEKMKDTFLAIVSHELRTPLNAIIGYAEMLKEAIYGPINEKQAGASERILSNSQRLLSLVNDLLDQARMEAGKLTIQMRPLKLAELLDNVYGTMEKIATNKGIALSYKLDPTLPEAINGDNQRLQQILVNLINNAIKFTDAGSVNINLMRSDKTHWRIEVTDTGRGIPENEREHIFEAFRQVEAASVREHGGFGLGLSIVKQLVSLMDGEIDVQSQIGKGSTFIITLPLVVPAE